MGKNIISQARGKGGPTYRAPSFRYKGAATHNKISENLREGTIVELIHCQGHSVPLMKIKYDDGEEVLSLSAEGVAIGDKVFSGDSAKPTIGNTLSLGAIPEGTTIYNIEQNLGDGGKFVRSSGCSARVVSKTGNKIIVEMPSKRHKQFSANCRATIGVLSAGGRLDKPLLKAGNAYYKNKARNKLWPKVSATAMNAVDHPFGCARSSRKTKSKPISKNAPPGRKVGQVGARRTGQRKRIIIR